MRREVGALRERYQRLSPEVAYHDAGDTGSSGDDDAIKPAACFDGPANRADARGSAILISRRRRARTRLLFIIVTARSLGSAKYASSRLFDFRRASAIHMPMAAKFPSPAHRHDKTIHEILFSR